MSPSAALLVAPRAPRCCLRPHPSPPAPRPPRPTPRPRPRPPRSPPPPPTAAQAPPPPHCRHPPKRPGDPHLPLPLPMPLPRPLLRYTQGQPPRPASVSRGRLGRDPPPATAPPRASPPARGALAHRSQASRRGACVLLKVNSTLKVKHQATSAWCPCAPVAATCRSISPASPPRATSHASPAPPPASPSPHAPGAPPSSVCC